VVATLGTGASSVKFELGKEADTGSVWGTRPGEGRGVQHQATRRDGIEENPSIFPAKEVFDFRPFNTTRFEITRGTDTRAFERVKGTGPNAVDT
jgi:hypothetical protein